MRIRLPNQRLRSNDRGPAKRRRALGALFALLVLCAVLPGSGGSAGADPSSLPSISISALTPSSQPSGSAFSYRVAYSCSNVNAVPCADDPTITIPLGAAASWPVSVGANPLITSWTVTGGNLVIRLADLTEGVAGTIGITVTPPNHTTPNGTTWTMKPTMTFTDGTPTVTTTGVTSTATSTPSLNVFKQADQAFYRPGDTVTYRIYFDCPTTIEATGHENLASLRIVDTLPAGLTYASSSPAGATVAGQTVTFDLTPAQIGGRCIDGAGTRASIVVNATVNANVANDTVLTNTVTANGTSISGATRSFTDTEPITVVTTLPGATVGKWGAGPLLNSVGDRARDLNLNGYRSATYPGAWLGRGLASSTSNNLWWNSVDNFDIEGMYQLDVVMPGPGLQHSVVDPVPCTANQSGPSYTSNAPGTLCQNPAFHPTMVTVIAGTQENAQNVGVPSAFIPQARLTDGSLVDLVVGPIPTNATTLANGPNYRSYFVPAAAVGRVAELVFPRTAGMTNTRTVYLIGGYADGQRGRGDILRNRATVSSYSVGATNPYATGTSPLGSIYILGGPQVGLEKHWSASQSRFTLGAEVFLQGPTSGDLTFVDRYPAGVSFTGPVTLTAYSYANEVTRPVAAQVSTGADPATGQTVVTIRVAAADINALLAGGKGDRLAFSVHLPSKVDFPGNYTNTATVNLSDPAVDNSVCAKGTKVAGTTGAGHTCEASRAFTVNPTPSSDAVRVSKSVRGSLDAGFKTFPAIGYVASAGGSATYRLTWTNKSFDTVGNVVAYDLLPRVGDTGTVAGTVDQPRGSTFRPTLTGVGTLPAGVTAFYSTATNPCRPEVLPDAQNPGCSNAWTALPASPSAALLATVTALKFASTTTYAFDQGFAVDLSMTTPALTSASQIAWNTFATGQTNLVTNQAIPPVESAKVGVARSDYSHITIDKVVDKATANVGDTLTYTVKAINDGGRDLTNVTLRDVLPAGVTFLSASHGGVHSNGVVTWTLASMPLGQQFTFTIQVRVAASDGSTLVNKWSVDGTTPVDPEHPCVDEPTKSCAETEIPPVPLTYAKTSNPPPGSAVKPGDAVTYTVRVTNATANASTTGLVTDDLGGVLDDATLTSPPTLTCAPAANSCGTLAYTAGATSFVWRSTPANPMAGNTVATITYTVRVDEGATGDLHNVLVEPNVPVDHPIISTDKVVDRGANALVRPGETLTYTLTIRNTGSVASSTFSVYDDMANVVNKADFVAGSIVVTPAGRGTATYSAATERLTWTGSLGAGQTVTVSYRVTVKANAFGALRNAFLDDTITNPIAASLGWRKVDPRGQRLAGASWELTPVDASGRPTGPALSFGDCTQAPCSGRDTDPIGGQFLVLGLLPGTYQLVETAAPAGFVRDATPIAVVVSGNQQLTLLPDVANDQQQGPALPFAGGLGSAHLRLIGFGLLALTVGLAAWQRKRRRVA